MGNSATEPESTGAAPLEPWVSANLLGGVESLCDHTVSYTHLDVYKRQLYHYKNIWATKKGLKVTPMTSDRTAAMMVTKDSGK